MTVISNHQVRINHLVMRFDEIYRTAMQDVPIVNSNLSVSAIGFRPWSTDYWEEGLLGVLITPWFINLIVLPENKQTHSQFKAGDNLELALPAGFVDCHWAHEEVIGSYLSCSLMSPVSEFSNDKDAKAVAEQTLALLLTFPTQEQPLRQKHSRRSFLRRCASEQQSNTGAELEAE